MPHSGHEPALGRVARHHHWPVVATGQERAAAVEPEARLRHLVAVAALALRRQERPHPRFEEGFEFPRSGIGGRRDATPEDAAYHESED